MVLGMVVYSKSKESGVARSLLVIVSLFFAWCFADLIIWATNDPGTVMFYWSLQVLIEPLIFLVSILLTYRFVFKKEPSLLSKVLVLAPMLPLVAVLSTKYNLVGVTLADCNAIEGFFAHYYSYIIETLYIIITVRLVVRAYTKSAEAASKKQVKFFGIGIALFLVAFSWGNIFGSFSSDWAGAQIGLISMPILVAFLSYLIVRFKAFNVKLLGAQAIVFALGFLVLAIAFLRKIEHVRYVVFFTLIFVILLGYYLIQSVKRVTEQRERLEALNNELTATLQQRESLTHLITHKIKGVLTRSKGVFSEMIEGSYGVIPPLLTSMAKRGLESDIEGVQTVDLVLNASNLSKGTIKYDMKPVDFKAIVEKIAEEKKAVAATKNLVLESTITEGAYSVTGDAFWLTEVVRNLVENALRYTLEGKVSVNLRLQNSKVLLSVTDTGVGITDEDKQNLFKEGGRGKDSTKINVDSTGYGLFTVKLIVDAHKGRVWAESEGFNKGTTFYVELDSGDYENIHSP